MPLSIYDRLFGSALADTQQRGADFSPDAPWAMALSAFPEARRLRPGATLDDIMRDAQRYLMTGTAAPPPAPPLPPEGPSPAVLMEGTNPSGVPGSNPGAMGQVTGVSGGHIGLGIGALAAGLPGIPGLAATVAGKTAGLLPDDLTMTTEEGPIGVTAVNTPTGLLSAIAALAASLGLTQGPVPAVVSNIANPNNDPEAMGLISVSSPPAATAGWVDTTNLTSNPGSGVPGAPGGFVDDPEGGTGPSGPAPGSPSTGPSGPGTGSGGVGTGAPGTGSAGDGTGSPGGPGPGEAGGMKHGGRVKGKHKGAPVDITAHDGEFVMNPTASRVAAPWLEALNRMYPPNDGLDALMDRARQHLEI